MGRKDVKRVWRLTPADVEKAILYWLQSEDQQVSGESTFSAEGGWPEIIVTSELNNIEFGEP